MNKTKTICKIIFLVLSIAIFVLCDSLLSTQVYAGEDYDYTVSDTIDKTGRTNVSDELNEILSLASRNGTEDKPSVVFIPDGTYFIGDTALVIGSNTVLRLSNNAVIKFSGDLETANVQMLISSKSVASGYNGMSNVEICGGIWDANQNSTKDVCKDGSSINMLAYAFAHSKSIYIHDTTIKNVRGEHAILFDGCKDITVEKVVFQDIYPVKGMTVVDSMEALHFDFCNAAGSSASPLDDTPCENINVMGCTFSNVSGGVGAHHDETTITTVNKDFYIYGNTFKNINGNAIDATYIDGVTIANNSAVGVKGDFIQAYSSKNLTVENNNADGARYGVYVNYGNHGSDNIVIRKNDLKNTNKPGIMTQVDENYISNIKTETSVTISDNKVSGSASYGIIATAFKARIENNNVDSIYYSSEIVTDKDSVTGIKVRYTKQGSIISGNTVSNTSRGIEAVYSDNVEIKNNDISDYSSEGIRILGSGSTVDSNTIKRGKMAIWFQFYPGVGNNEIIKNNNISNSSKEGIWAFSDYSNIGDSSKKSITVEGNSVNDVCDFGICVQYFGTVNVSKNRITSIAMSTGSSLSKLNVSGIKVEKASSGASINDNMIYNSYTGIWTTACNNVNIKSNAIRKASSNGIRLTSSCTNVNINNNSLVACSNNIGDEEITNAILSIENKSLNITGNMVYSDGKRDITVWGPSTNDKTTIAENSVKGNPGVRIYSNSANNDIHDNYEAFAYTVSGSKTELGVGEWCLLQYSNNDLVDWVSSDCSIATVDLNGCVKAIKEGQCVISVVVNGRSVASQSIAVSAKQKDDGNKGGSDGGKEGTEKKYSNEWVNGKWYEADGSQKYSGIGMWKGNATGWWFEDTSGWYPVNQWQKIDGIWYFFKPDGYLATNEYYNGYWFNNDGSWDSQYLLSWKCNSTGWWVEDISGWWPASSWLKIDGYWYYFDASGYMVTNVYIDGYWIGADGVCL